MSTTAVIINPKSGRGRGKGQALSEILKAQRTTADVTLLENFAQLEPALQRAAAQGVTDLFISSGDGTIQFIQTWLAESGHFKKPPRLCLLPHGTTNMTAADLGFQNRSLTAQAAFIANVSAHTIRNRPTVRVANPKRGQPLHGMFFGTGAVADATRYCQVAFNDRGVHGQFATFATLFSALMKSIFFAPNPADPNRFDRPYPLRVASQGNIICDGNQLMMLATTLEKLMLNSRPFWGGATAPLRVTTIPYPVPNIPRWIFPTLFGGENRRSAPGSTSTALQNCDVTCPTQFVLDGEFYDAPEHEPLRLETGPRFEYIVA